MESGNRLIRAKEVRAWSQVQWNSVIWSDEARFEVCIDDSRSKAIRTKDEVFQANCLKKKVKFAAFIMIWVSSSSDLSPIETLWHNMKKELLSQPARTGPEHGRLQEIWN
ncbi:hypothetical protein Trydic_g13856 [Trypoxylus dichotomus]